MLAVEGVRFGYPGGPEFAFTLSIGRGEVVTLSGASGSGKSTLVDLVCGFLQPSAGDILWERRSILGLPPAKRPVSALFQTGDLFEHLDVGMNIALGLDPRGRPGRAERARVSGVLEEMDLAGFERRLPGQLSGGQRQRVALARALVRDSGSTSRSARSTPGPATRSPSWCAASPGSAGWRRWWSRTRPPMPGAWPAGGWPWSRDKSRNDRGAKEAPHGL